MADIFEFLFSLRKLYQWIHPIRIKPEYYLVFDNSGFDEIRATITNRSSEPQYVVRCVARGTYSFRHIAVTHIRKPFIPSRLYPTVWFGGINYNLLEEDTLKIDPSQPVKLRCKMCSHPLNVMITPFFLIEAELSSGKIIRSNKMRASERWRLNRY